MLAFAVNKQVMPLYNISTACTTCTTCKCHIPIDYKSEDHKLQIKVVDENDMKADTVVQEIAARYGVLLKDQGVALRGLFIINPEGVLEQSTINNLPIGRSVDEALRLLQAIQFTAEHGEVRPMLQHLSIARGMLLTSTTAVLHVQAFLLQICPDDVCMSGLFSCRFAVDVCTSGFSPADV